MTKTKQNQPRGQNRGQKRTKQGPTAISSMVRVGGNIANVVASSAAARYGGKTGMSNLIKDVSMMKMLVNAEEKQVFTLPGGQTVYNAQSLVYGIGTMAQGTTSATRVGDSVKITRIDLNLAFYYSSGTATTNFDQTFNWYLVRYKKTPSSSGTTAPNISEFLLQDGGSQYTPISFPNPDTIDNFQLMSNGQVQVKLPTVTTASSQSNRVVNVTHACNFHQEYSGSAATTITDNMCFVIVTAAHGVNTGGASGVSIQACMWYLDN